MQDIRPVVVDRVRIVELEVTLTHVHRVRRETAPREHDGRVGRSAIGRWARVRRRRDGQVKVGPTVTERLGYARHLRTDAGRKIGRVENFSGVGGRKRCVERDVDVGIRAGDQHGCIWEKDGGGVVQPGNTGRGETGGGPARALGCVGIVDGRRADGTRSEGLVKGHLIERKGVESLVSETGGAVGSTVDDEEGTVGKGDELAHGAPNGHVVVLLVDGGRAVLRLWSETLAVGRGGVGPGIVKGPGVVAVVIFGHVRTATKENGWGIIVGRGERKHCNRTRGRVYTGNAVGHVWKGCLDVPVRVP